MARKYAPYTGSTYNVLLALADWADKNGGSVYPGQQKIAFSGRLGDRTVKYAIRRMEADAVIVRVRGGQGRGNRREWRIVMDSAEWHLTPKTERSASRIAAWRNEVYRNRFASQQRCKPASEKGASSDVEKVQNPTRGSDASILRSVRDSSEIRQNPEPISSARRAGKEESSREIIDRVMRSLKVGGRLT